MKKPSHQTGAARSLPLIGTLVLGAACSAHADDVTMVEANLSWLDASVWSDNAAPSVANDYFTDAVGNGILRTSPAGATAGGDADFTGNSVTVVGGTRFLIKQEDGETASINGGAGDLIVDGGRVSFAPNGGGNSATLSIDEFRVTSTTGALLDVGESTATSTIDGTLTGEGDLLINFGDGDTTTGRMVSFAAVDPSYPGKITVSQGMTLDFGSDVEFAGGLELTDTAILNVDQSLTVEGGRLIDSNGFVPGGVYTGEDITDLGPNFTDAGGILTVTMTDSDGDGLNDFWEDQHFGNDDGVVEQSELDLQDGDGDPDGDGADNEQEETAGTDPNVADTDGDGIEDGPEITGSQNTYDEFGDASGPPGAPTDPLSIDSDGDGLEDGAEIAGTDNDDVSHGFGPTNPNSDDTDADFLLDQWEIDNNLDPTSFEGDDGDFGDPDGDGLDNFEEQNLGTDPRNADTDGDGLNDGDEEAAGTDPFVADTDGDGIEDGEEVVEGSDGFITDPTLRDSDEDGFSDSLEIAYGSDPTDADDFPADLIVVTASVDGITVEDATSDASGVLLTTAEFDMNGGNAVALMVTTEGLGESGSLSATFAGQAMTGVTATQGVQSSTIFYLIDPATTSGVFEVTTDPDLTEIQLAYSQIALSNVPAVAAMDTATSDVSEPATPLELSYTTTTDDAFVLGAAANNDHNEARILSIDSGNPDTDLLSHTLVGTSGHFHTYGRAGAADDYTDGYLGQYQRTAITTVVFGAAPPAPTDPVRAVSAEFNGGAFEVTFENLDTGTAYQLEHSPNLESFAPLGDPIMPAAETQTFVDDNPAGATGFYRLSFPD